MMNIFFLIESYYTVRLQIIPWLFVVLFHYIWFNSLSSQSLTAFACCSLLDKQWYVVMICEPSLREGAMPPMRNLNDERMLTIMLHSHHALIASRAASCCEKRGPRLNAFTRSRKVGLHHSVVPIFDLWQHAACQPPRPVPPCWVVGCPVNEVFVPGANPRTPYATPLSQYPYCRGPCTCWTKAERWTFNPSALGWLRSPGPACGALEVKG